MAPEEWLDAHHRVDRARQLYDQGRWAEAAVELRAALTQHPDQGTWHFNLALTLEAMEDYEAAVASFEQALILDGEDVECLNCLAADLARLGRYDESLETFDRINRVDPHFEPSYCNRIAVYTEMGNHEQAEVMFYLARQIVRECPVCSYNIGNSLFVRGQVDRAILCWRDAIRQDPEHPHAQARIAEAMWQKGDHKKACDHFRVQLEIAPDDAMAMLDYGDLLVEMNQLDAADKYYRRALRLRPTDTEIFVSLGELSLKRGRDIEARRWLQVAVDLDGANPRARVRLAQALLRRDAPQQAAKNLTLAIKSCRNEPRLLQDIGRVLMDAHLTTYAHGVLGRLAKLCPDDAVVRHNLAVTCFRLRRLDEGIRQCRAALRLRPKYPLALYNLAMAHMKLGQLDRARCCVDRAMQIDPSNESFAVLARRLDRKDHVWSRIRRFFSGRRRRRRR